MKSDRLAKNLLRDFEKTYDHDREARALQSRGEFLAEFPIERLNRLKRDNYVIGLQKPTFCDRVEVRTRSWAVIQGSTAIKFGIYFGKKKVSPPSNTIIRTNSALMLTAHSEQYGLP